MGVSWESRQGHKQLPRHGAPPHWVCRRAKVGYDLRAVSDPSLRRQRLGTRRTQSAPRSATHRPFRAGQADAAIAASFSSDVFSYNRRNVK